MDPVSQQVAAGDTSGRILLWPGVLQQVPGYSSAQLSQGPQVPGASGGAQAPGRSAAHTGVGSASAAGGSTPQQPLAVRTEHWHAESVGALCFSLDGTLLLSGGREAVLVSLNRRPAEGVQPLVQVSPPLSGMLFELARGAIDLSCTVRSLFGLLTCRPAERH